MSVEPLDVGDRAALVAWFALVWDRVQDLVEHAQDAAHDDEVACTRIGRAFDRIEVLFARVRPLLMEARNDAAWQGAIRGIAEWLGESPEAVAKKVGERPPADEKRPRK